MIYQEKEQLLFVDLLKTHFDTRKIVTSFVASGVITTEEMMEHVRKGTAIGNQYCSDVVRLARDSNYKRPLELDMHKLPEIQLLDSTVFIEALEEIEPDEVIYEKFSTQQLKDELKKETEAANLYRTLMMHRILWVMKSLASSYKH